MARRSLTSSSVAPGIPVVLFVETGRWQAFSDLAAALRSRGVRVVRVTVTPRRFVGRVAQWIERPLYSRVERLVVGGGSSAEAPRVNRDALAELLHSNVLDIHVQDDLLPSLEGLALDQVPGRGITPGTDPAVLLDKLVQASVAGEAGVASPRQWHEPLSDVFPVVVKGTVGFGGKQVRIVHDADELRWAWDEFSRTLDCPVFVQEYLPHRVNSAGVARDGELLCTAVYFAIAPDDDPTGAPSRIVMTEDSATWEAPRRFISSIGYSGVFALNWVKGEDEVPRLIDFNPRIFGSWSLLQELGVDVLGAYLCLLGLDTASPVPSTAVEGTGATQLRIPRPPGDRAAWRRESRRIIRARAPFLGRRWQWVMRTSVLAAGLLPAGPVQSTAPEPASPAR